MLLEVYTIRPWEMGRFTASEWRQIVDVEKRKAREAQKEARSQ